MTDDTARLRVILSSSETWDDPSEDLLFMFFEDIEEGAEQYFIVERVGKEQQYVQTIRCGGEPPECKCTLAHDGAQWTLERREGGADSHWSTLFDSYRDAHEVLFAWCRTDDPSGQDFAGRRWEKVTF